jgi:hypothetical protein
MNFLFQYLSILNVVDAFSTYFGLKHSYITELNPFMGGVYHANPLFFLLIKLSFSVVLLWFVVYKKVPGSSLVKGLVLLASSMYTITLFMHLVWVIMVLI